MPSSRSQESVFYFFGGTIAILLSWLVTGCRLGNRVEQPENPDKYTGYYVTQPQTLTFYATTSQTQTKSAPVSLVPYEVSAVITNPVAVVIRDLDSGSAVLYSPVNKVTLPVYVKKDFSLSLRGNTASKTFWKDPSCESYLDIIESGSIQKTSDVTPPANTPYRISGKLRLTVNIVTQFRGNCAPTFQSLALCYNDASQCGAGSVSENQSLQSAVISNFSPLIQSGVITASDIPNLVNYAYQVTYE